jgi:cytoskeletal protein CcmA (bactofilin family)
MSEITYISEELVMEGTLDSAGSSVVLAGRFKGELRAKDVLLESNSIFDGNLVADKATLGGLVKGEVSANILNVASSAKVEGNLKTNALSIDLGAEVSGSITRISK